jgi:hypothetical protein
VFGQDGIVDLHEVLEFLLELEFQVHLGKLNRFEEVDEREEVDEGTLQMSRRGVDGEERHKFSGSLVASGQTVVSYQFPLRVDSGS